MKRFILSLAVLSVALWAYESSAKGPEKRLGGERGTVAEGERKGRPGQRGGPSDQRDPQQIVARMIEEFDKDGDEKLNAKELAALLKSMRERRSGQGARPSGRQGGPGSDASGGGKRRGGGPAGLRRGGPDRTGKPGGERPKRPVAESK